MRQDGVEVVRRAWVALPEAPADLLVAARAGGRVSCTTLARRRGWWMPEHVGGETHIHLRPKSGSARLPVHDPAVLHWAIPIAPATAFSLETGPEDALEHVARCLAFEDALVVWESAIRTEGLDAAALRGVGWLSLAARRVADAVEGLSDSGLETLLVLPLRDAGYAVRPQHVLAGHRVDMLIGERLVVQIDGFGHHSSSAQRSADVAHDALLRLRGYTVLRFTYAQVVHDRTRVLATIRQAVAQGLHRAD